MTSRNTGIEARKCTWFHKICIAERKKADILNWKNFLLKFIVLGCYAPSIFIILLPILAYIYREPSSVNFVHLSRIYTYFFRLNGLCPFRLGLFFIVEFVLVSLVERCFRLRPPFRFE